MKFSDFFPKPHIAAAFCILFLASQSGTGVAFPSDEEVGLRPRVDVAVINGMVGPVSQQFIEETWKLAELNGSRLLIIQLDTPGGLLSSTREIVKLLLGSRLPIAVYVAPSGSRAGSAGVFITMAAHIAAMAPGTNIGAAHPVSVGLGGGDSTSAMNEKILNDAAAFIKTIAGKRDRNWAWADSAVRYSVSVTEREALQRGVIDLVAEDLESLVDSLHGRLVALTSTDSMKLTLSNARIVVHEYSWRYKLLDRLSDPNIAYILFLVGLMGLYFELSNPGLILPGVAGGISLILAFFAFQTLPINYAGVLLLIFAIILPGLIISDYSDPASIPQYQEFGIIAGIIVSIGVILFLLFEPREREEFKQDYKKAFGFFGTIKHCFKSKSFRYYVISECCNWFVFGMLPTIVPLYAKYVLNVSDALLTSLLLGLTFISATIFMTILWKAVVRKIGNRKAWIISMSIWIITLIPLFFINNLISGMIVFSLIGMGLSGSFFIIDLVVADIVDEDETVTGMRREAGYYGVNAFVLRFSNAFVILAIGSVFSTVGWLTFEPSAVTADAISVST